MALLGAHRRDRPAASPTVIASRLLEKVLDTEKLQQLGTLNILDFGRANSASLELFNQFSCRLSVLDTADTLLAWSADIARREADEPPTQLQLQHELGGLLSAMGEHRYDLVFLWDTVNHLHERALPAFSALLRRHLTPHARGHGFMLHKRESPRRMRRMGLGGTNEIRLIGETDAELFPHTRKTVSEALGPDLQIDHAVLHADGRLEYLLSAATVKN